MHILFRTPIAGRHLCAGMTSRCSGRKEGKQGCGHRATGTAQPWREGHLHCPNPEPAPAPSPSFLAGRVAASLQTPVQDRTKGTGQTGKVAGRGIWAELIASQASSQDSGSDRESLDLLSHTPTEDWALCWPQRVPFTPSLGLRPGRGRLQQDAPRELAGMKTWTCVGFWLRHHMDVLSALRLGGEWRRKAPGRQVVRPAEE